MIFCKELKKEFENKQEMFAALKENKELIKAAKKATIKFSDPVSLSLKGGEATKAEGQEQIGIGSKIFAVINTTNWLDSHGDVHIDGIWDVSAKDQNGKLYYIINHDLELGKVIAYPGFDISVPKLSWSELGLPYSGTTQALIFEPTLTEATNKDALYAIVQKEAIQNSVRMQYISMTLCIDDDGDDFKQERENFYKYLPVIANKQDAIDAGYFWAITEAKIYKEGSAVLFGSNESTPILYSDPAQAGQNNKQEHAPQESRQVVKSNYYFTI